MPSVGNASFKTTNFVFVVASARTSGTQSQASAFDEDSLNMPQFAQLVETFLGDAPTSDNFRGLVDWVREGYSETEEERLVRLIKVWRGETVRESSRTQCNVLDWLACPVDTCQSSTAPQPVPDQHV